MEPPKPPMIQHSHYDYTAFMAVPKSSPESIRGISAQTHVQAPVQTSAITPYIPPSSVSKPLPVSMPIPIEEADKPAAIFIYKNPIEQGEQELVVDSLLMSQQTSADQMSAKKVVSSPKSARIPKIGLDWKEKKQSLFFRKFYEEISREKEEIDKLNNNEIWDKMKKIGNPFELIFTTYHRKRKNDSISKYIPLSRSYFKMWEIYNNFPIFQYFPLNTKFRLAHLAEGPGGFMEASYNYIQHLRTSHYHKTQLKQMMNKDVYHGITLKPHNDYVPDWNKIKKIFGPENNVHVHYGNLYIYEDVVNYCAMFGGGWSEKAHIVTADGGFDYSSDFNGQELNSCQIIYSEMAVALNVLAKHGTFICKVFDLFSIPMLKMLEIMKQNFEYLYIYKPETSRPANSEKYIICMNYLDLLTDGDKAELLRVIQEWNQMVTEPKLAPIPEVTKPEVTKPEVPKPAEAMVMIDGKARPAHLLTDAENDCLSCACCGNTKKEEMMITAFLKAQKKLLGFKENDMDDDDLRCNSADPKDPSRVEKNESVVISNKPKKKRKKKSAAMSSLIENSFKPTEQTTTFLAKSQADQRGAEGRRESTIVHESAEGQLQPEVSTMAVPEKKKELSDADQIRQNYYIDFSGIKISNELIYLLNDYNNKYMECQKRSLQKTLNIAKKNPTSIIEKEDYEMLIRQQVKNAYNWCTKYNISINEESIYWQKYRWW